MFKALATDVDGTITDSKLRIDPEAIIRIREFEDRGIPVILISGHGLCSVETLSEYIGTTGALVAENGCLVVRKRWGDPVLVGSREVTELAYKVLKAKLGDKVILKPLNKYRLVDLSLKRTFNAEEANRILLDERIPASVVDSGFALHIIDSKVNKGVGLAKAAELMNIRLSEIIGIGDGGNDYHFIQSVGYGIALGQAPENVKKVAKYVTRETYAKGFIEAVEHARKLFET
ncbi:MAG: phosphoglycolate phosphatase [Candidatus Odinarchaeum yellowstonii]|uniref:Phosphoglycolate phosphatase n=1 Tax=Odinarchaeota yellowstonii (strain LCB_4) TaxID=1841599 RepID=A0AAF0D1G9_ODILC|nr:MAG: phosphoglycolate phosphatase [Candidatus Odinarchaeum yellowstonii]